MITQPMRGIRESSGFRANILLYAFIHCISARPLDGERTASFMEDPTIEVGSCLFVLHRKESHNLEAKTSLYDGVLSD